MLTPQGLDLHLAYMVKLPLRHAIAVHENGVWQLAVIAGGEEVESTL